MICRESFFVMSHDTTSCNVVRCHIARSLASVDVVLHALSRLWMSCCTIFCVSGCQVARYFAHKQRQRRKQKLKQKRYRIKQLQSKTNTLPMIIRRNLKLHFWLLISTILPRSKLKTFLKSGERTWRDFFWAYLQLPVFVWEISKGKVKDCKFVFSRDAATLYERVSVRPSVRWSVRWSIRPSVTLSFFGLLGATNAVYTAPLLVLSTTDRFCVLTPCP